MNFESSINPLFLPCIAEQTVLPVKVEIKPQSYSSILQLRIYFGRYTEVDEFFKVLTIDLAEPLTLSYI